MGTYVVFRLYGPMVAWGDIAVGERRPIGSSPSRSGVLGLLGAALGIPREDAQGQRDLDQHGFASLVEKPGALLTDFHTIQSPAEKLLTERPVRRADELSFDRGERGMQTILSYRDYRTDAMALACVWPLSDAPRWTVERLAEALRAPSFLLYLGRKSCPLALPLCPQLVEASHPVTALQQPRPEQEITFLRGVGLSGPRAGERCTVHWERGAHEVEPDPVFHEHSTTRRDRVRDASRRQFQVRQERSAGWIPVPKPASEREEEVP